MDQTGHPNRIAAIGRNRGFALMGPRRGIIRRSGDWRRSSVGAVLGDTRRCALHSAWGTHQSSGRLDLPRHARGVAVILGEDVT